MDTNSPLELTNLTSITGIILFTMFLVEILKRAFGNVEALNKIPAFIYAVVISALLALLANKVLKTSDGSPYLEGSTGKVIWAAVVAALGSSGFYSWLRQPVALKNTSKLGGPPVVMLLASLLLIPGCAPCPERPIIVNTLDQGSKTIRKTQLEWTELLGADPAKRAQLPTLTPAQQENFRNLHKDFDATIEEFKAQGAN